MSLRWTCRFRANSRVISNGSKVERWNCALTKIRERIVWFSPSFIQYSRWPFSFLFIFYYYLFIFAGSACPCIMAWFASGRPGLQAGFARSPIWSKAKTSFSQCSSAQALLYSVSNDWCVIRDCSKSTLLRYSWRTASFLLFIIIYFEFFFTWLWCRVFPSRRTPRLPRSVDELYD